METQGMIRVVDADGVRLYMDATAQGRPGREGQATLWLEDGQQVVVPADLLQKRADGTYALRLSTRDLRRKAANNTAGGRPDDEGARVIPVVEERLDVRKREVAQHVQVHKLVHEHEEVIDEPVFREDVEVERVPIGREVDGPVAPRYEGDVFVIPLLEEVLVVERRLVLREELRITKRRVETREVRHETLRSEEARIDRLPGEQADEAERQPRR